MPTQQKPLKPLKPIEQCPDGHYYNTIRTGDICAVCGKKLDPPPPDESETKNEQDLLDEKSWVCGWLVCIKGINKGRPYIIKDGKNFIGSTSDMDIQILGDKKNRKEKPRSKRSNNVRFPPKENNTTPCRLKRNDLLAKPSNL